MELLTHILTRKTLEGYLAHLIEEERSLATLEKYKRDLRLFYLFLPQGKKLDKGAVLAYKEHLISHYAPASVNAMLAAINGLLRYSGWHECRVKPLKIQRKAFAQPDKELTKAEYLRLVETAQESGRLKIALLLQSVGATGVRASEVQYLTVEAARRGRAIIRLKGKVRTILLPKQLCQALLAYAKTQKIRSGEVFLTRNGRGMNRKEIWAAFKRLCSQAGVPAGKVFPHNLRHLFARTFYAVKRDLAKLADVLGHSSVETTRIYLVSTWEEHARYLDEMRLII